MAEQTMLERVAQAIWDAGRRDDVPCDLWEVARNNARYAAMTLVTARAAIAAMREPGDDLLSGVMQASLVCVPINRCEQQALQVWQNTIDAILGEPPASGTEFTDPFQAQRS